MRIPSSILLLLQIVSDLSLLFLLSTVSPIFPFLHDFSIFLSCVFPSLPDFVPVLKYFPVTSWFLSFPIMFLDHFLFCSSPVTLSCRFRFFVFSHHVFHHSPILFLSCNIFLSLHDFCLFPFLSIRHPVCENVFSLKWNVCSWSCPSSLNHSLHVSLIYLPSPE